MIKDDNEKAKKILQDFEQLSTFSIDGNLDEFRHSIEKTYFQIQDYLNEEC